MPAASFNPGRFPGRVSTHINALAIFWIIISAGHVAMGSLDYLLGRAFTQTSPALGINLPVLLPVLFTSHAYYELAYGVAGGLCAWALIARLPLARRAIISLSVLSLLTGAFGLVLGAYTLWIMLAPGSREEYQQLSESLDR